MSFHHLIGKMDRRSFLASLPSAISTAGMLVARPGTKEPPDEVPTHDHPFPANGPAWRRRGHIPVFDAHLHIPSEKGMHWQVHPVTPTPSTFVAYLEYCGVGRGVINSVRSQVAESAAEMIAGNREVLRYRDQHPNMLVPACIVMPQFLDESLRELEDWRKKYGCVWIGELCNYVSGFSYETPAFTEIMKQVKNLGMVIQIHTTDEEMAYLVSHFPDTKMVFPHMGTNAHIQKRVELLAPHPNCYFEIAGSGHDYLGGIEYAVQTLGADRVLFGSDLSINDPSGVIAVLDDAHLSDSDKEKVFHRNVEKILTGAGYDLGRHS
jgi:predicted TIM-barrel fold metal-dependent hydrolase